MMNILGWISLSGLMKQSRLRGGDLKFIGGCWVRSWVVEHCFQSSAGVVMWKFHLAAFCECIKA
ncbi:hypothetical protein [Bartonella sp. MR110HLJHH]|uniref:hypothetical protein n=1 Tax=Bartonella sp. MR110HLJHH TaxID=3243555 RepID=UPI0035CF4991